MKLAIFSDLHFEWSKAVPKQMKERVVEIQKAIQLAVIVVLAGGALIFKASNHMKIASMFPTS
jgi:hypothetical protein